MRKATTANVRAPSFKIHSLRETVKILGDNEVRDAYKYLISIGDVGTGEPYGYQHFERPKLRLEFDDITLDGKWEGSFRATSEQVKLIIDFCQDIHHADRALIHCFAGISRSAAAACILSTIKMGSPRAALDHVQRSKPSVYPNKWVLLLADDHLKLDGALISAAFTVFPQAVMDVFDGVRTRSRL